MVYLKRIYKQDMKIMKKLILTTLVTVGIGLSAMAGEPVKLAVRMDDMGAFHSVNTAVMDIYRNGISQTVELMPVASWYPEAVRCLKTLPAWMSVCT